MMGMSGRVSSWAQKEETIPFIGSQSASSFICMFLCSLVCLSVCILSVCLSVCLSAGWLLTLSSYICRTV